jgi:hypothetical protein
MCCGPVCISLAQGIPAALVTLTVGIAGWFIARHQGKVAQAKLKLDLFDKRYPIFLETWQIMSEVVFKGTREKNYGLGNPFSNFIPQARFLFGLIARRKCDHDSHARIHSTRPRMLGIFPASAGKSKNASRPRKCHLSGARAQPVFPCRGL